MIKGWICPKCNAVMNPNFPTCFYCKPKKEENDVQEYKQLLEKYRPLKYKIEN